jgi:thiaminase
MNDASSFSERMRAQGRRTWNAILGHRFFREVATDAIDDRVFVWYLRIEYGFVDTAARVLGCAGQGAFISGAAAVGARSSWAGHRSRTILHQCI